MRFTTPDPLAEKYYSISPYVYVANNPLKFIDPTGMSMDDYYVDKQGEILAQVKTNEEDRIIVNELDEVTVIGERIYTSSQDYSAYSISGTIAVAGGVTGELSLGFYPKDGIVLQLSLGTAVGFDISASASVKHGKYIGLGEATAESMTGISEGGSIGAGLFSISRYKDIELTGKRDPENPILQEHVVGSNWQVTTTGISIGSKSFIGGSGQRTYTFKPFYLYKK